MARLIGTAKRTAVHQRYHAHHWPRQRSTYYNLQLLCGNIGIEGGGIKPASDKSNVQGACDMRALPNNSPGAIRKCIT